MSKVPKHPLRCRCGKLQGHVELDGPSNRMVCYCQDCQAFARFLGPADKVLNAQGGSDIVQCAPNRIRFTQGVENLAVMRLSPKGMLRWYAGCCRTPIGNTMDRRDKPFAGLLTQCLDSAPVEPDFGSVRATANTQGATGETKPRSFGMVGALLRILGMVAGSRLSGRYKDSPFFKADGSPVTEPLVLTPAERAGLNLADASA